MLELILATCDRDVLDTVDPISPPPSKSDVRLIIAGLSALATAEHHTRPFEL
jgi:hypothetical protein